MKLKETKISLANLDMLNKFVTMWGTCKILCNKKNFLGVLLVSKEFEPIFSIVKPLPLPISNLSPPL